MRFLIVLTFLLVSSCEKIEEYIKREAEKNISTSSKSVPCATDAERKELDRIIINGLEDW